MFTLGSGCASWAPSSKAVEGDNPFMPRQEEKIPREFPTFYVHLKKK